MKKKTILSLLVSSIAMTIATFGFVTNTKSVVKEAEAAAQPLTTGFYEKSYRYLYFKRW